MGVALNEQEIAAFLEGGHTGILTSLRADGWPVPLPVWFVYLDDRVYVRTQSASKKVTRLRRDDRVSFLVESGKAWKELKSVVLTGHAVAIEDEATLDRVGEALDEKYAAFRSAAKPKAAQAHYATAQTTFRIDPVQAPLTWDNTKLTTRKPQ